MAGYFVFACFTVIRSYLKVEQREVAFPSSISDYLSGDRRLYTHPDETSRLTGFLVLPEGPLCVSSMPVITSNGEGLVRGTVIIGQFIDEYARGWERGALSASSFRLPYRAYLH
jgi:sensor domain CHASE-containing protein